VRWLRPSSTKSTPRAVLIVGWFGKEQVLFFRTVCVMSSYQRQYPMPCNLRNGYLFPSDGDGIPLVVNGTKKVISEASTGDNPADCKEKGASIHFKVKVCLKITPSHPQITM